MRVAEYLSGKFLTEEMAEVAMRDFSILLRRIRKWKRGTNDSLSVLNLYISICNQFDDEFIEYIIRTRYNKEERGIVYSCDYIARRIHNPQYNREFYLQLEADIYKAKRG